MGAPVVVSAEMEAWPDRAVALLFPNMTYHGAGEPWAPFAFPNSGAYMGRARDLAGALAAIIDDVVRYILGTGHMDVITMLTGPRDSCGRGQIT
jgi:hypothetical protein